MDDDKSKHDDEYDAYADTTKFTLTSLVEASLGLPRPRYSITFGYEPQSDPWIKVESELSFVDSIALFRQLGMSPETEFEQLSYGENSLTNWNIFDPKTQDMLSGVSKNCGAVAVAYTSGGVWQKTQPSPYRMQDLDNGFLKMVDACTDDIFFCVRGTTGPVNGVLFYYFQRNYPRVGQSERKRTFNMRLLKYPGQFLMRF